MRPAALLAANAIPVACASFCLHGSVPTAIAVSESATEISEPEIPPSSQDFRISPSETTGT
eukprot:5442612-Prymnesium_polylepis.1